MSFNKRYINEHIIKTVLREDGLEGLIQFIKHPDNVTVEDEYSENVCDIIRGSLTEEEIIEKLSDGRFL